MCMGFFLPLADGVLKERGGIQVHGQEPGSAHCEAYRSIQ